jgi:hypothetical protein
VKQDHHIDLGRKRRETIHDGVDLTKIWGGSKDLFLSLNDVLLIFGLDRVVVVAWRLDEWMGW